MDALANQIIERKVIDRILAAATFKEVPYELETADAEAIDQTAGGHEESDIPEAKPEHEEKAETSEEKPDTEEKAETEPENTAAVGGDSVADGIGDAAWPGLFFADVPSAAATTGSTGSSVKLPQPKT